MYCIYFGVSSKYLYVVYSMVGFASIEINDYFASAGLLLL